MSFSGKASILGKRWAENHDEGNDMGESRVLGESREERRFGGVLATELMERAVGLDPT